MSYPKPLSEKSISRLYADAGLSDGQIEFVRRFVTACANLYGVFTAGEAWAVYQELSSKTATVRLRRKDLFAALGVLRRERLPFYVFEADEVFASELRTNKYRVISLRELAEPIYGRYQFLYIVSDDTDLRPFYVPENLLDYAVTSGNKYETALLELLGGLQSTLTECKDSMGHTHPCPYTGQYLKDFSYISGNDALELSRLRGEYEQWKGNAKKAEKFEAKLHSVSAAQYLINELKWYNHIGYFTPAEAMGVVLDGLDSMGVEYTDEEQLNDLYRAVADMCNHQRLWCYRGGTTLELRKKYGLDTSE